LVRAGVRGQEGRFSITARALGYLVNRYVMLAKVENMSCHECRYRFGCQMAERAPLHRLAQIMGHNSLSTTMVYVLETKATRSDLQGDSLSLGR